MKIWNEINEDVFSYFQWFDKNEVYRKYGHLPQLGVFSVNGSNFLGSNNRKDFLSEVAKTINNVFLNSSCLGEYIFYLFANVEISKSSSVVIKSKKLWKNLNAKWSITDFNSIQELKFETDCGDIVFTGVASFGYSELEKALEIIASNPKLYTIIAKVKTEKMDDESIKRIFENSNYQKKGEIDYFNLIIEQCLNKDIVFRLGDSSEEMEIAVIYNNEFIEEFTQSV
ncbi:MAG: hypothetical protein AB9836_11330 [Aminipila sp.]